jgi:hypothetical protein
LIWGKDRMMMGAFHEIGGKRGGDDDDDDDGQ